MTDPIIYPDLYLTPEQMALPCEEFREQAIAYMIYTLGPRISPLTIMCDGTGTMYTEFVWPIKPAWIEEILRLAHVC